MNTSTPPKLERMGICLSDATNQRLLEGVALLMELTPVFLREQDLADDANVRSLVMLVADGHVLRRYLEGLSQTEDDQPALVAATNSDVAGGSLLPHRSDELPFDGLIPLPQLPAVVLAQLSVILYAHRANVQRYASAMDELHLNRKIFRSVTSGISVASATEPDLPLIYVNPAFEVMTGYALEDIAGKNCRFLQGEDRDQPGLVLVREAIKAGRETVAILRNYKKDGTPFWNELALSPIYDPSGHLTHFVGIQNDVTARVEFEEALRESEKLAAVGRLAASIAHEINNPLEAVTNLIYLARNEGEAERKAHYLEDAEKELHRVALLTTQSLRFYRQSSKPQAVRPTDLLASVLDVYSVKLRNYHVQVERRDRTCQSIVCLESEIRQVLSNLVRNAMDAMRGSGGRLLARVREGADTQDRRGVIITIADTGIGMSEDTVEKLYTAFFTTKGTNGTGLGLWVSSEIVQRHHGVLRVRSAQGPDHHGTVFTLFLPYQAATPDRIEHQETASAK